MPPYRASGNGGAGSRENHSVHAGAELMDVIRDLCRVAAVFLLIGRSAWAEALIEQCADLLTHRAPMVAGMRGDRVANEHGTHGGGAARFDRGTEWTN